MRIVMMVLGSIILGNASGWASNAPIISKEDAATKRIEEGQARLTVVSQWLDIINGREEADKVVVWIASHRADLTKAGLNALCTLSAQQLKEMEQGLRKLTPDVARALKIRQALLKSTSGRSFATKAQQLSQSKQPLTLGATPPGMADAWRVFQRMEHEEFRERQVDMANNPDWELVFDAEKRHLTWSDLLAKGNATMSFDGKIVQKDPNEQVEEFVRLLAQLGGEGDQGRQVKSLYVRMGIILRVLTDDEQKIVKEGYGMAVKKVKESGLAEEAGLKEEDVILSIAGKPVVSASGFKKLLMAHDGDGPIRLTYIRKGVTKKIEIEDLMSPPRQNQENGGVK